jgi:hypothetical protein
VKTYIDHGGSLSCDGMSIPKDPKNRDYQIALAEVDAGEAKIADYVPPPPPVPQRVTRFQARAALLAAGLLDTAIATVAATNDPFTQLVWAEASEWRRDNERLVGLATAIGLNSDQIDDLFRTAAQITA